MVVPTYPEGGSHALQVCQHHHQVVRVGHFVGLAETQGTWCSRLLRPIRLKPSQYNSAQCALLYREGGGRWPVRPRVRGVLSRRIARWGQIGPNPNCSCECVSNVQRTECSVHRGEMNRSIFFFIHFLYSIPDLVRRRVASTSPFPTSCAPPPPRPTPGEG